MQQRTRRQTKDDRKRFGCNLPFALKKRLEQKALDENTSEAAIAIEALSNHLGYAS